MLELPSQNDQQSPKGLNLLYRLKIHPNYCQSIRFKLLYEKENGQVQRMIIRRKLTSITRYTAHRTLKIYQISIFYVDSSREIFDKGIQINNRRSNGHNVDDPW